MKLYIVVIMLFAFVSCKNETVKITEVKEVVESNIEEGANLDVEHYKDQTERKTLEADAESEVSNATSTTIQNKEREFKIPEVVEGKNEISGRNKVKAKKKVKKRAKPIKKGRLRFKKDVFDFGFIEMGEIIDHSFTFTNTGTKDVIISNATATCGCTTPIYPFIPIEPGQSSKIDVRFNSKGRLGNQTATVKVISDGEEAIQELTIKGVVRTEIVSPSEFVDSIKQ